MPLNKLDNFLKNVEGRILYVSPSDLDSTDNISNSGNAQTRPFKTLQRALIEAARFSYVRGNNNDEIEKTTILLMPGEHIIDNRPGYAIDGANAISPAGVQVSSDIFNLDLESNFDLTQEDNILYKFNSIHGGVVVPRGVSIIGLDLRKTKLRPKYVPNPTDSTPKSAIFRITGGCYFWQFSIFDGDQNDKVYTNSSNFTTDTNYVIPTFSHHKLTCFEYADGVNKSDRTGLTDLNMYYYKLSRAYNTASTREIKSQDKYPSNLDGFKSMRPEYEIVGAFGTDPVKISQMQSGDDGTVATNIINVITQTDHNFEIGTPIKIKGAIPSDYNISTVVTSVDASNPKKFTFYLPSFRQTLEATATVTNATVTIETDTVDGSSPYIFNCSLRSVYGMNGMVADGSKSTGFRSMVVAQFTGISLQKDDRAFVKYDKSNRQYGPAVVGATYGADLALESSSTNTETIYHLDSDAIYRSGWETAHVSIINDAILQIVSVFAIGYNKHFTAESGGDASITNSNSNFGQLALVADGFKKNAFDKDDKAYLTHIITPKAITPTEDDIDWISIDTTTTANDKLYLYGFNDEDIKPPFLTQGYRIGAKLNDKLYVNINNTSYEAPIYMINDDGSATTASVKEYSISTPGSNIFTTTGTHQLATGESVIIVSDNGDLPENITNNTVYYVIRVSATQIKLAASKTNADANESINVFGGSTLKVLSRVTDKSSGDIGHPIQWSGSQWYIQTVNDPSNTIYGQLGGVTTRTEPSYVKRIADTRNLDDKLYKLRISIPQELSNSKTPESGFVIQESSNTGFAKDSDFIRISDLTRQDFDYARNLRYISSCTYVSGTGVVNVSAERPHNLKEGDLITIKSVTTTDNIVGAANSGYNGEFTVDSITNASEFTYKPGRTLTASVTNDFNIKSIALPRFERTDLKSNIYLYRNQILEQYENNNKDGVYYGYPLNSSVSIPTEFTTYNYSQNIVDLYPQVNRDNTNDNPPSASSFASRSPLGKVTTNDLQNSITRETIDKLVLSLGIANEITSVSTISAGISTITFSREHNFAGIVDATPDASNSGFNAGTYYNVKLYTSEGTQDNTTWNGTRATVVVDGTGKIASTTITEYGSGWQNNSVGWLDKSVIGTTGSNGKTQALTTQIVNDSLNSIKVTGVGTMTDRCYLMKSVPSKNQIAIGRTSGDPDISSNQYALLVDSVKQFTASTTSNVTTFTTTVNHNFNVGSRFEVRGVSDDSYYGTFTVGKVVGINAITVSNTNLSNGDYNLLPSGLDANDAVSEKGNENLSVRGMPIFGGISETLDSQILPASTSLTFKNIGTNHEDKFPYGSYAQIDNEIIRFVSKSYSGAGNRTTNIIRGVFGTVASTHIADSVIKKINPLPIEFHRPSILRASGHTFEYLGYGPGNYSTSLPQVQIKTLTEEEEYLSQSQERGGGAVVYTGMNNKGDFYIGNQKQSALTGENASFDIPVPTVAGEDPGRLSVVFDEVSVKERLVVEGGGSNTALSEFDGPVTFGKEVQIKDLVKIKSDEASTGSSSGALVISGGVGIGGTVNVGAGSSIRLPNDSRAIFGDNNDLGVYHTGSNGIVTNTTGQLQIQTPQFGIVGGDAANYNLYCVENAQIQLYYSGDEKLKTTNYGIDITGICTASSFSGSVPSTEITGIITSSNLGNGTASDSTYLNGVGQWSTINNSILIDSGGTTKAEATTNGVTITGTLIADIIDGSSGNIDLGTADTDSTVAKGTLKVESSTQATAADAVAALQVVGGVAIGKKLYVGDDIIAFNTSDRTLKENIIPIENPLSKVLSISGNTFTWKYNSFAGMNDTGVIAQEIEALGLPGITTNRTDGTKAIRYEKLIPLLIEAVKELSAKVEVLEQKL